MAPLLVALVASAPAGIAEAEKVLTLGDSVTLGEDDERYPDDRCGTGPPTELNRVSGFRGILECRLGANGQNGFEWSHSAESGRTSVWGAVRIDQAIATLVDGETALVSLHVNDGAPACGRVCDGGARDTLACVDDSDCPGSGAFCDLSSQHSCSSAESRANIKAVVDALLADGYTKVVFWKSPGRVGLVEGATAPVLERFDGSADAIDTLFLTDLQPIGYADDARVEYVEETYEDFCVGSGLQGCDPDDGLGDRRTWWFAADAVSTSRGEGLAHVHPNAWGYMELAARLGERIDGAPLNTRPPTPSVSVLSTSPTTIQLLVPPVVDLDGDPVTIYTWASCAETSGESSDPSCDSTSVPKAPFPERECGAVSGADHNGLGVGDGPNPGYVERRLATVSGGGASLTGLAPGTRYRICAVAYDGFQGSLLNDSVVTVTAEPMPAAATGARLLVVGLIALASWRALRT